GWQAARRFDEWVRFLLPNRQQHCLAGVVWNIGFLHLFRNGVAVQLAFQTYVIPRIACSQKIRKS
ncbi:hypothetical protein, partial [Thermoleptolyngbya sp.]